MHSRKLITLLFLLMAYKVAVKAQYVAPDSLHKIIATAKEDTVRIDAMNWLSFRYFQKLDSASCSFWAEKALSASKKINYKNGEGFAFINLGNISGLSGNDSLVTVYTQKAKIALEAGGNKGFLGIVYSNMALRSMYKQSYLGSLRELNKSLELQQESGFKFGLAHSYMSIGIYHFLKEDYSVAKKNLIKSVEIFKEQNENTLLSYAYYYGGVTYSALKEYGLSLTYLDMAKEIFNTSGEAIWFETEYNRCAAMVYLDKADSCLAAKNIAFASKYFDLSEGYLTTAIQKNTNNDIDQFGLIYNNLGWLYLSWKKYDLSQKYFRKSLEAAQITRDKRVLDGSHDGLSRIDSINGDFKSAFSNYKKHILYRDSITSEENIREIERYKIEFETEKKVDEIKLLTTENNLKNAIVSKQKQQKYYVLGGAGLLVLAGGYGFFRYRQRKKMENEKALSFQKQNISRDLHDEIGATLSGIAMYSHLAKTNLSDGKPEEVTNSVNIIQHSATEMVTKLNDIIWLINPGKESLDDVIAKLKEYAQNMCMASNIALQVEVSGENPSFPLPIETRKNIYLLCKEAVNNAAKYSNASLLIMTFCLQENNLEINIKDDGKGFDITTVKQGNGLENMQKRADDFGGKLQLITSPGNGTHWQLSTKITHQGIA